MSIQNDRRIALKIAEAVAQKGGKVYFVGGCVRDALLGKECKDFDIEVHGIGYDTLKQILETLGKPKLMGASFGVFGLSGCDLDIAMPRKEKATGRGHKDFEIYVDPFIGEANAAARRDFTINAMMQDVLTGEILDFYGGHEDLKRRILRHVKAETFVEDPLRVYRGAQFAARFGFELAPETIELCRSMDLSPLSRERVYEELNKALLKAEKPSIFFEELRRMDSLQTHFPELEGLIGVRQDPIWHPEGDVWTHTMMVVDEAARLRAKAQKPRFFMLSALCHDFGKKYAFQPDGERIHASGHETAGLEDIQAFLERLTNEAEAFRYVPNMTILHMQPCQLVRQQSEKNAYMQLFDKSVCPEDLLLLAQADTNGKTGGDGFERYCSRLYEMLRAYKDLMALPQVRGADLLAAGMKPGPEIGRAVASAHELHLQGIPKEDALQQVLETLTLTSKVNFSDSSPNI